MMRLPRARFTIGRLMIAVLVLSVILWGALYRLQVSDERRAEAAYKQAILVLEVAEYAFKEYVVEISPREIATVNGQIAISSSEHQRALDRLEWSRTRGQLLDRAYLAARLALDRSNFELEQAQTRLEVLRKYTIAKQIKELESDIEKARAAVKSRREQYELERSRRKRMLGL